MTVRFSGFLCAAASLAALYAAPAFGQKQAFTVSKGWYNQPDLQGIWMPAKPIDNLEKGGFIKDPSNGKIPYVAGAKAKPGPELRRAPKRRMCGEDRCYMPGLPRLMTMGYPFQIVETEKYVSIISEYSHTYRMVYLDGSPHLDFPGLWNGDARGKWDGDSLVTDVTNFNDQTWLDKAGNYHSDKLHVTERLTRTGPTSLLYEATISDPATFTKDWKIAVPMTQKTGPTARILEHECQDLKFGQ